LRDDQYCEEDQRAVSILAQTDVPDKPLNRGEFCQQQQALLHEAISSAVIPEVSRMFNQALCAEVTALLGRDKGQHRASTTGTRSSLQCPVCGRQETLDFVRKGYYERRLLTQWGVALLDVPRVKCVCGRSPAIPFSLLPAYDRLWSDMNALSLEFVALRLSLRSTVTVLQRTSGQTISIGTVQRRVQRTVRLTMREMQKKLPTSPPVILLDALWGTVMVETGEKKRDKRGRLRKVKRGKKIPVLVALGMDPQTGETRVLAWVRGVAESIEDWTRLLTALYERGVHWQSGLRVFVHDGSAALETAVQIVDFGPVRRQRCVFHKLRNVGRAVMGSEGMSRPEKRERINAVLADASAVYKAASAREARERAAAFRVTWGEREPQAVATLERDFEQTLTCYVVQEEARAAGETWLLAYLRTTSALERLNRDLRSKWRQAGAFGSEDGQTGAFGLVIKRRERARNVASPDWLDSVIGGFLAPD
jgi:transposase-like protein